MDLLRQLEFNKIIFLIKKIANVGQILFVKDGVAFVVYNCAPILLVVNFLFVADFSFRSVNFLFTFQFKMLVVMLNLFSIVFFVFFFWIIFFSSLILLGVLKEQGYKAALFGFGFKDPSHWDLIFSCFLFYLIYFHLNPLNTSSVYFFFPVVFSTHYKRSIFSLIYFMPKRALQTFSSYRASIKNTTANANKSAVVLNQSDLKTVVEIQQNELNNLRSEKPQFIAKIAELEAKITDLLKSNKKLSDQVTSYETSLEKSRSNSSDFIPESLLNSNKLEKFQTIIINKQKIKSKELAVIYLNFISLCSLAKINFQTNWLNKKQFTFGELLLTVLIRPEILGELTQEFMSILQNNLNQGATTYLDIFNLLHTKNLGSWLQFVIAALHDKTIIFRRDASNHKLVKTSSENIKVVKSYPKVFSTELYKFSKFLSDLTCFIALPLDARSENGLLSDKTLLLCEPILDAVSNNFIPKIKKDQKEDVTSSPTLSIKEPILDFDSSSKSISLLTETSNDVSSSEPSSNQEVSSLQNFYPDSFSEVSTSLPVDSSEKKDDITFKDNV